MKKTVNAKDEFPKNGLWGAISTNSFEAFPRVLGEGLDRYPVELFSFTLMLNHWHMVLRPSEDGLMGRMLRWVTATHTRFAVMSGESRCEQIWSNEAKIGNSVC